MQTVVKLKPTIDERVRRLEALRKKERMQAKDHLLHEPVERLHKRKAEFLITERCLRKRCEKLEEEYQKELEIFSQVSESTKQKRGILKAGSFVELIL